MRRLFGLLLLTGAVWFVFIKAEPLKQLQTGDLFVTADYGTSSVTVVKVQGTEATTVTPIDTLDKSEGAGPAAAAFNHDGSRAYTANFDSSSVTVVNTSGEPHRRTISLPDGAFPYGIAVLPDDSKLYVASSFSDTVDVIDLRTEQVTKRIELAKGTYPYSVEISPSGKRAYTVNRFSDSMTVIDTASDTVVATVDLPKGSKPTGLAISTDGSQIYTANRGGDSVSTVDARTLQVVSTLKAPAGSGPRWVAATSDGSTLITANQAGRSLTIFDTKAQKELTTLAIPSNDYNEGPDKNQVNPMAVAVSSDDRYAYVVGYFSEQIAVVDIARARLTGTIQLQHYSRPYHMAHYSAAKRTVHFIDENVEQTKTVAHAQAKPEVLSGTAPVAICLPYQGIAWPQTTAVTSILAADGSVAETDFLGSRLRLFDTNKIQTHEIDLGIGTRPNNLIFDATRSRIFVAREGANSVSEITTADAKIVTTYDLPPYSGPQQIALSRDEKYLLTSTVSKELLLTELQTKQTYTISMDRLSFVDCSGAVAQQTRLTPVSLTPNLSQSISAGLASRNFSAFSSSVTPYSNPITRAQDKKQRLTGLGLSFVIVAVLWQMLFVKKRSGKSRQ